MGEVTRSGAEILVDVMHQEGIERIFGYPGGAAIPIFDALVDSPIDLQPTLQVSLLLQKLLQQ